MMLLSQIYGCNRHPDRELELTANQPGLTALMLAAYLGELNAARNLLEQGASVSLVNCYSRTPLMLAAMAGQEEIVQLLLSVGAASDGVDAWGMDAAGWAEARGYPHIARLIKTAARERKQWMISQMRGGSPLPGSSLMPSTSPAAFDPVAERTERAAALRAEARATAAAHAPTQGNVAAEAKFARQHSVRGKPRSGWGLGMFSQRRPKEAPDPKRSSARGELPPEGSRGGGVLGNFLSSRGGSSPPPPKAPRTSPGYMSPTRSLEHSSQARAGLSPSNATAPSKGGKGGGGGGWPAKWMFSSRNAPADKGRTGLSTADSALLAPPPAALLTAGHVEAHKNRPADDEERAIAGLEDGLDASHGVQDAFVPARSAHAGKESVFGSAGASGRMTPKSIRGSARDTGRSIVLSTRSLPGYVSQSFQGMGAAEMRDLYIAVKEAAAMPNTGRVPTRVVPLSAVRADAPPRFHDRKWEIGLRARHEQRIDPEPKPRISEIDRRNHESSRRRNWVNSSRRWIETKKNRAKSPEERQESRRRLYATKDQRPARVYA